MGEEGRNAYGGGGGGVCIVAPTLGLRQACKGEEAPSLASSWPFHKWAGCTGEGKTRKQVSPIVWLLRLAIFWTVSFHRLGQHSGGCVLFQFAEGLSKKTLFFPAGTFARSAEQMSARATLMINEWLWVCLATLSSHKRLLHLSRGSLMASKDCVSGVRISGHTAARTFETTM